MAKKTNFTPAQKVLKMYKKRTRDALLLSGALVAGQAKLLVPKDTTFLAGSITYAMRGFTSDVVSPATKDVAVERPKKDLTVYIGSNVEYAAAVEFGTHNKGSSRGGFGALSKPDTESKGRVAKSYLRAGLALSKSGIRQIFREI